jgi:hypothetical protein
MKIKLFLLASIFCILGVIAGITISAISDMINQSEIPVYDFPEKTVLKKLGEVN